MKSNKKTMALRRRPAQARSAANFDQLLKIATLVLEDVGWEGFTTNLLAERAGVGLQALYRYFPNKLAVLATLTQQMIEEWDSWFDEFESWAEELELEELWTRAFDVFVDGVRFTPGCVAIRRAISASPQLKELDLKDSARLSYRLAKTLVKFQPALSLREAKAVSRVLVESLVSVVDLTFEMSAREATLTLRQCKTMQLAYIKTFSNQ